MADGAEDRPISIDKRLVVPLSPAARQQAKEPALNFSYEEEFYIFFDALATMTQEFHKARFLAPLANIGAVQNDSILQMKESAIRAAKTLAWLGKKAGLPPAEEGKFHIDPEKLDPAKRKWAEEFRSAISKDEPLIQAWSLRMDQLLNEAQLFIKEAAMAEMRIFKSPNSQLESHMDKASIEAEDANHRWNILTRMIEKAHDEYWVNDRAMPDEEIKKFEDEYIEQHKDELKFLHQRRKATVDRIIKRLESDPKTKADMEKSQEPGSGLAAILETVLGMNTSDDCGNPDCPVHGKGKAKAAEPVKDKDQQRVEKRAEDKQPVKLPIQQLPRDNKKDERDTTNMSNAMTTTPKKPGNAKGKDEEDELKFQNVSVQFVDDPKIKHIQLPKDMTLKEGRYWLQKIEDEETRTFNFEYKFTGWAPLDAMWATYKALVQVHGFAHVGDFQSWFGPVPPSMITIDVDYGKTEQMPWGPIEVHGFSAPLTPSIQLVEGQPTLQFNALIRNNERFNADRLMKVAKELLKKESIYRGKAIDVDFEVIDPRNFRFDPTKAPKFWDTSGTKIHELIMPKKVERLVKTNIWTPIRKTQEARDHKIPLRRAVLLAGKYGVGKTLGAKVTAKIAQDNGWTFIYLRKLEQLKDALYFARNYQPAVIFAEDINRITSGKRDEEMDVLFNTIDGVDRKNDEVMLVFTTNNIEEIHPGMIRPGRIDTVIEMTPPDAEATERLIRQYGVGLLEEGAKLTEVAKKLEGQIPAIIREAVERSKLSAMGDHEGDGPLVVKPEHLETAADEMLTHAEFLKEKPAPKPDLVVLGEALGNVIAVGMRNRFDDYEDKSEAQAIKDGLGRTLDEAGRPNGNSKHPHA